jgi:hypothetical protein
VTQRALRAAPTALAVAIVLLAYAFFATRGTFDFMQFRRKEISFYVQLQQGFYAGQLSMKWPVEPHILALPNPYDPKAREGMFYAWDASYLNGRYYLYHSALPVLLGYVPMHVVLHNYAPDQLIVALFCAWAFVAMLLFVREALAGARTRIPLFVWALFLGVGNAIPFVLSIVRAYEVAIACGMAMTACWALAVLRLLRAPSTGRAVWMGVWLALAIAARPNLLVLGTAAAAAMVIAFRRQRALLVRAAGAFAIPLAVTGAAMLWYNAARFGDPFEFGLRYQLTSVDMTGKHVCGVRSFAEAVRVANNVLHYLFMPPIARSEFPYLDALGAVLDPAATWPSGSRVTEQVIGLAPLMPLAIAGAALALLFAFVWRGAADAPLRAAIVVMAGAWLILAGLSTCWWIVARYSLEFMMLMAGASVVLIERALAMLPRTRVPRLLVAALALWSVLAGLLLGFNGPGAAFRRSEYHAPGEESEDRQAALGRASLAVQQASEAPAAVLLGGEDAAAAASARREARCRGSC